MKKSNWVMSVFFILLIGCASSEMKPVDLFPEDQCAHCRMAVSDEAFASEIITPAGEVFIFDDLGCLGQFIENHDELVVGKIFVKDYHSRSWLEKEHSVIVQTSVKTPMGSGKVAFADSVQARRFAEQYPSLQRSDGDSGSCSCCNVKGE